MKVFSTHRKKIEPKKRFGGLDFRRKVKKAANYKRVLTSHRPSSSDRFWRSIGLKSALWRWSAVAVVLVLFYFFVLSSKLVVANVQVSGNSQISSQNIQDVVNNYVESRGFLIKKGDFFTLTESGLNQALVSQIPTIRGITAFHKSWPNNLSITVTERTPGFALESSNKYFLVDDEGVIIKEIDDPQKLLVVQDSLVEDFATDETLPNPQLATFIISMNQLWPSKIASSITTVKFPGKAADEVEFTSSEGWTAFFSINRSASTQLSSLALILGEAIPAKNRSNLAYVDLRLSNWAYYCYNQTPCQQQPEQSATGASSGDSTTINSSTTNATE